MRIFLVLISGAVMLIGAGIAYIWISAPTQMDEVAIISAENTPYKVVPANPGGAEIKNTDSIFLNSLDRGSPIPEGGEQLLPEDPVPELPPIDITNGLALQTNDTNEQIASEAPEVKNIQLPEGNDVEALADDQNNQQPSGQTDPSEPDLDTNDAQTQTSPESSSETKAESQAETQSDQASDQSSEHIDGSDVAATESENAASTKPPENSASSDTKLADTSLGDTDLEDKGVPLPKPGKKLNRPDETKTAFYRVQLASFRNESKAMQTAAVLMDKHSSRLNDILIGVTVFDSGEDGMYWRVVTDPMPRLDAKKLCNIFKSVGQDCILRTWK